MPFLPLQHLTPAPYDRHDTVYHLVKNGVPQNSKARLFPIHTKILQPLRTDERLPISLHTSTKDSYIVLLQFAQIATLLLPLLHSLPSLTAQTQALCSWPETTPLKYLH